MKAVHEYILMVEFSLLLKRWTEDYGGENIKRYIPCRHYPRPLPSAVFCEYARGDTLSYDVRPINMDSFVDFLL